jgi:hypothetical protein
MRLGPLGVDFGVPGHRNLQSRLDSRWTSDLPSSIPAPPARDERDETKLRP